jgi:hypothetical protein
MNIAIGECGKAMKCVPEAVRGLSNKATSDQYTRAGI